MKNWIRVGGRYINLDQVIEITRHEERKNYKAPYVEPNELPDGEWHDGGFPIEPCVVFYFAINEGEAGGMSAKETVFFGDDCNRLLQWLGNDVESEITNINFFEAQ